MSMLVDSKLMIANWKNTKKFLDQNVDLILKATSKS